MSISTLIVRTNGWWKIEIFPDLTTSDGVIWRFEWVASSSLLAESKVWVYLLKLSQYAVSMRFFVVAFLASYRFVFALVWIFDISLISYKH